MNPARVYDLSFVSKDLSLSRQPEIAIHMAPGVYEKLVVCIPELTELNDDQICAYLKKRKAPIFLLKDTGFGYKSCCRLERQHGEVQLYLELRAKLLPEMVVTLVLITYVLGGLIRHNEIRKGQSQQLLAIDTYFNSTPHGHCPAGQAFPAFGRWLKKQVGSAERIALNHVQSAMGEVWRTIAPRVSRRHANECRCIVYEDGRFSLDCPGDACDLAIYPEMLIGDIATYGARIGSHNVESAVEQLTLLAGLAEMWGSARKAETLKT